MTIIPTKCISWLSTVKLKVFGGIVLERKGSLLSSNFQTLAIVDARQIECF